MEFAADYQASLTRSLQKKDQNSDYKNSQFKTPKASKDIITQFDVKEIDSKALQPAAKQVIKWRQSDFGKKRDVTKQNSTPLFGQAQDFPWYKRNNADLQEALEDIFEQFDTNESDQGPCNNPSPCNHRQTSPTANKSMLEPLLWKQNSVKQF